MTAITDTPARIITGYADVSINDETIAWPGQFTIEDEAVIVADDTLIPDPEWTHIDPRGHWHAYTTTGDLPTLNPVDRHIPCNGNHRIPDPAGHCEGVTVTEWYCRICNTRVEPGRRPGPGRTRLPGPRTWHAEFTRPAYDSDTPIIISDHHRAAEVTALIRTDHRKLLFGVARAEITDMTGTGTGIDVTIRLYGIGPLGERHLADRTPRHAAP